MAVAVELAAVVGQQLSVALVVVVDRQIGVVVVVLAVVVEQHTLAALEHNMVVDFVVYTFFFTFN